ncbi:hypothetical protein RND81_01G207200 [Saponaria officinalis]|uniref:Protein TILLER ANGLE CONTROL 1 n=1 Tax=Saponaria officinalis TaxID=3572 RepID=A0AAW1NJW6_SAPOF
MKVFNWVTRRLLNVSSCIAVLPDEAKENTHNVSYKHDVEETQALLEHGAHMVMDIDVLEDWKDGLLAIGTLAIGPLETTTFKFIDKFDNNTIDLQEQQHYHNLTYNNSYNNNNMEENPLMNVEMFSHELDNDNDNDNVVENNEIIDNQVTKDECQIIKKRVTLADLFLEDSNHSLVKKLGDKPGDNEDDVKIVLKTRQNPSIVTTKPCVKMIKPTSRTKQGLSTAKKFLKEDVRPLKKINQLMKRMMKKKIHPDFDGKMHANMEMPTTSEDFETNESATKLLTRGENAEI